jgi:hypothetical protein
MKKNYPPRQGLRSPALLTPMMIALLASGLPIGCSRSTQDSASADKPAGAAEAKPMPAPEVKPAVVLPAMELTMANFERFKTSTETTSKAMNMNDVRSAPSLDEGHKRATKVLLVDSMTAIGFDLEATLKTTAARLHDGNLTPDESTVAVALIGVYRGKVADLARWGFITQDTKNAVEGVVTH